MIWNGISDMLVGRGLVPASAHACNASPRDCLQHVRPQPVGSVIPARGRILIASCAYEVELLVGASHVAVEMRGTWDHNRRVAGCPEPFSVS